MLLKKQFLILLGLYLLKKYYIEEMVIFCLYKYEVVVVIIIFLKFEFNKLKLNVIINNDEKDI